MQIHGHLPTTLLDYPGHVATTIFLGGCNFRCPFCHNKDLVEAPSSLPLVKVEDFLAFLRKRKGILTGVCITGGEPTLQADLPSLIASIRDLGYLVKLDTNGSNPAMLASLLHNRQLDYVAMDLKNSPSQYATTCGLSSLNMNPILESTRLLLEGTTPYEFRTTAVKNFHSLEDFQEIASWIKGDCAYFIQNFEAHPQVITQGLSSFSKEELQEILMLVQKQVPAAALRGL